MELKDSATIAYSVKPQMLTIRILKDGVMDVLKGLASMKLIKLETDFDYTDGDSKKQVLSNLKRGFKDMQAIKRNKLKTFPAEALFNV